MVNCFKLTAQNRWNNKRHSQRTTASYMVDKHFLPWPQKS